MIKVEMSRSDWDLLLMILSYNVDDVFSPKLAKTIRKQIDSQEY